MAFIRSFAPLSFVLTCLILSIPQTDSYLVRRPLDDPLAYAPTVDFDVDPSIYSAPPGDAPETPVVPFAPDDPDFHGFSNSSQVLDVLLNQCDARNGFDLNCGLAFHEAVFGKSIVKPTKECCHVITKEGKLCHDLLVKFIFRFEGPVYDRGTIFTRSENLWWHCLQV